MSKNNKKNYSAEFKAKIALESLNANKTLVEIAASHNVPTTNVKDWQNKLKESAINIFLGNSEEMKKIKSLKQNIEELQKIIGKLTINNEFYKKKLEN